MMRELVLLTGVLLIVTSGCERARESQQAASRIPSAASSLGLPTPEEFSKQHPTFDTYWYQGMAELTRYALLQSRYGELHDGEAVLIFVTEDFLPAPQVKEERGDSPEAISVLKVNAYRRFYTGIYPYTMMTTSFTPTVPRGAATLKVSSSIQEWCGQVYSQINRRDDGLHSLLHSYFQGDADQTMILPSSTLEDGLWARLRIDPSSIREGEQEIVPGLDYIRMRHKALRAYPAKVTRNPRAETDLVDHPVTALAIGYPALGRELVIYHEPEFPFVIQAWEEKIGPQRTTAVRANAIIDDYWHHNSVEDAVYREALGLTN